MMTIEEVLKDMRSCESWSEGEWIASWADVVEAEIERLREQRFGPLVPPTAGAIAVFETVVMNSPTADMRAIPNQWLLNERALTSKVAEELETEIERLRAAATRYLAHSDSGTYRDSAGLRPGTSPAGEDLRAALAGKATPAAGSEVNHG